MLEEKKYVSIILCKFKSYIYIDIWVFINTSFFKKVQDLHLMGKSDVRYFLNLKIVAKKYSLGSCYVLPPKTMLRI